LATAEHEVGLHHFNNTTVVAVDLSGHPGHRAITGRVLLEDSHHDDQDATAKLVGVTGVHPFDLDPVTFRLPSHHHHVSSLQSTMFANDGESTGVELQCNTYQGTAWFASILAVQVEDVERQTTNF
jgi:hypothetical protein